MSVNLSKWRATEVEPEKVLFAIFQYWADLSRELGCPELRILSEISRQAVDDFLEDPYRMVKRGDKAIPYMPEVTKKSSHRWLFDEPGSEGDFGYLCRWLGPQPELARQALWEAAFAHRQMPIRMFYADDPKDETLTEEDDALDNDDGGSVYA